MEGDDSLVARYGVGPRETMSFIKEAVEEKIERDEKTRPSRKSR
jgi:hypothetical protein